MEISGCRYLHVYSGIRDCGIRFRSDLEDTGNSCYMYYMLFWSVDDFKS